MLSLFKVKKYNYYCKKIQMYKITKYTLQKSDFRFFNKNLIYRSQKLPNHFTKKKVKIVHVLKFLW